MSRFRNLVDSRSSGEGGVGTLGRFRTIEYRGGVCASSAVPGRGRPDAELSGGFPIEALGPGAGDPWRDRVWRSFNRRVLSNCSNCSLMSCAQSSPKGASPLFPSMLCCCATCRWCCGQPGSQGMDAEFVELPRPVVVVAAVAGAVAVVVTVVITGRSPCCCHCRSCCCCCSGCPNLSLPAENTDIRGCRRRGVLKCKLAAGDLCPAFVVLFPLVHSNGRSECVVGKGKGPRCPKGRTRFEMADDWRRTTPRSVGQR